MKYTFFFLSGMFLIALGAIIVKIQLAKITDLRSEQWGGTSLALFVIFVTVFLIGWYFRTHGK